VALITILGLWGTVWLIYVADVYFSEPVRPPGFAEILVLELAAKFTGFESTRIRYSI
jgi:hypothetical protein